MSRSRDLAVLLVAGALLAATIAGELMIADLRRAQHDAAWVIGPEEFDGPLDDAPSSGIDDVPADAAPSAPAGDTPPAPDPPAEAEPAEPFANETAQPAAGPAPSETGNETATDASIDPPNGTGPVNQTGLANETGPANETAPPPEPVEPAKPADTDGDGIPDSKDGCDSRPETFNGYQDRDGCPDKKPRKRTRSS